MGLSLAWTAAMGDVKLSNPLMLYNTGLFPLELLTPPGQAGNAHSRAVPMVCGGGNCQEKYPPCEDLDGDVLCPDDKVCIDERLDTNALSDLLSKRPPPQSAAWCVDIHNAPAPNACKKTDPFPNFAIWYGEGVDSCCPKAAASKDTCQSNLGSQSWTCP